MAELIATGTTEADSSDFTVSAGGQATLSIRDAAGSEVEPGCRALVQIKASTGQYFTIGDITEFDPCKVLQAVGTFRVKKLASTTSFGVDKD